MQNQALPWPMIQINAQWCQNARLYLFSFCFTRKGSDLFTCKSKGLAKLQDTSSLWSFIWDHNVDIWVTTLGDLFNLQNCSQNLNNLPIFEISYYGKVC